MKNLIVSSADAKYSHLIIELYTSLLPLLNTYDFAVLDCGLDIETLKYFKSKNIQVIKPDWEFPISKHKIRGRENLKIQFSRFYLDKYFPGYENYIWLDSDTWINCHETFNFYKQGAEYGGFSITPQVDRHYKRLIDIKWLWNFPKKINSINYKNLSKMVSYEIARKLAGYYTLNAGCFAYNINFEGMRVIRSNLELTSKKGRIFGSDQAALALSFFQDKLEFEILPSYCNWFCETILPKFSKKKNCFVEPYTPNANIALIHLAGMDEDRKKDLKYYNISILEGGHIQKHLRFQTF